MVLTLQMCVYGLMLSPKPEREIKKCRLHFSLKVECSLIRNLGKHQRKTLMIDVNNRHLMYCDAGLDADTYIR